MSNGAPRKSQADFYVGLCTQLILCDPLCTTSSKDAQRDAWTMKSRVSSEGLSFLTKSLPKLGKALDLGLETGRLSIPREFKRITKNVNRPAFMQVYFSLVFDEDGMLLELSDAKAVKHLRQVLYHAYKLELPYSESEVSIVIDNFIRTEEELEHVEMDSAQDILELAAHITRIVFRGFNPKNIVPRHGPGAVATGERLEDKWKFSRLYNNIHQVFPYYKYFVVGGSHELLDRLEWYKSMQRLQSGHAKVVLVPKDSRGPRLISCEPLEYQWIQQGVGRNLVKHLESHRLTKGRINFTLQEINRSHAFASSTSRSHATLDLKDASDRVSLELVRRVFKYSPELVRVFEASRTTATVLPDGRIIELKKFAPMGSALCFPVEAYIFWSLLVAFRVIHSREPLEKAGEKIFVYGDDIIVPTDEALRCIQVLESVGLRVNRDKSCITGFFRESCGLDAFKGEVVTPLRLRKLWTGQYTDGTAYDAYVSLANRFQAAGYKACSDYLWAEIEKSYGKIPYGSLYSSFPCRVVDSAALAISLNKKLFRYRVNRDYQRVEFFVKRVLSARRKSKLDGWLRLMRNQVFPPLTGDPSTVVLPRSTKIKRSWAAVYD